MTKTKKPETGWIIRNIKTGRFFSPAYRYEYSTKLAKAGVFSTRSDVRQEYKIGIENILQVELNHGLPTRIIGGNGKGSVL